MARKLILSSLLAIFLAYPLFCQNTDSLEAVLDTVAGNQKVKTLNELFRAHLHADPVKAVGYSREALTLAREINDRKGMAASYNNLGVAYRNQGALDKALEYYMTSMDIYDSLQNTEGMATTKNNIATIYAMKKDYGQAMQYLQESNALFQEIGDPFRLVGSMNNLGNLYNDIHLYDKALKFYTDAYAMSEKNGAKFADPLTNTGNVYFNQGNYQMAIGFYEKALEIERAHNNQLGVLNIVTNIGITYAKAKQPKPAQKYLDEALRLTEDLQAYTSQPAIYKASAENYANQNLWKKAFETQLKYDELREKIYGEESSRRIAQMEMAMEFQEKERQLELLTKESEIQSLHLYNSRLFIVLIILGVFVILGVINFIYMDRKKKLI